MNRMRAWLRLKMGWIPRPVRRAIVLVIGGTLLLLALIGFIMPIMPGFIFLPFGLAILAVEFAWAARWLKKVRRTAGNVQQRVRSRRWWWGGPAAKAAKREDAARKDTSQQVKPSRRATPPDAARAA